MSLRGAIDPIPLEAILQLLAETGKTGNVLVRGDERAGMLGLSAGRLVSARSQDETGPEALGEIFTVTHGEFGFAPAARVDGGDLSGDLDDLLDRAVAERDRIAAVRELIPDERMRFSLSPRAADQGQVRFSADQWRALLAIDGQRDVRGVAERLGIKRLAALDLLAGLVKSGMVDTLPPAEGAGAPAMPDRVGLERTEAGETVALSGSTRDFALETIVQLLAATKQTGRIDVRSAYGTSTLGLAGGRLVSARSDEETGELALGATFAVDPADFQFVPMGEAPARDLTGDLDDLLERAAETRDRIAAIRALVPNERGTFVLSERATRHPEISLTPDEWKALLAVNGERDLAAIASHLGMRRLPTMVILADLIEGGLVDVRSAQPEAPPAPVFDAPVAPTVEPETPAAEVAATEPLVIEAPAREAPLAETPLDVPAQGDDRLSAITAAVGPAEPITEVPPPPPTWDQVPAEPAAPAWEAPVIEEQPAAPSWETPAVEPEPADPRLAAFGAPAAPEAPAPEYVDPRLSAFGAPPAEPVAEEPTWTAPATEATGLPAWTSPVAEPPAEPVPAEPAVPEEPAAADLVVDLGAPQAETAAPAPAAPAEAAVPPAAAPAPKRGMFGGLFGAKQAAPVSASPATAQAQTRAGQLALFVNELLASYNSGRYGKGHVEDRMTHLLMRVDEHADPVDRPIPVKHDRLDVGGIDGAAVPERQSLPYLAMLTRQVYDDAERALGRDKAKRGFRDTRERLFGKDVSLFQAPEVAQRVPKV